MSPRKRKQKKQNFQNSYQNYEIIDRKTDGFGKYYYVYLGGSYRKEGQIE